MFETTFVRRALAACLCFTVLWVGPAWGQENAKKSGAVPITFVPPPLDNATYSVGIYEVKTGRLARRLCEAAGQDTFKIGLNGLITSWDGKDDDGKPLPPGRYAARGFAVGKIEVEGVDVLGNDWAGDDERLRLARVDAIVLVPGDGGIAVAGHTPYDHLQVARYGGDKAACLWVSDRALPKAKSEDFSLALSDDGKFLRAKSAGNSFSFRLADGEQAEPPKSDGSWMNPEPGDGQNGTRWKIEEGVLCQYAPGGDRLRSLAPKDGEPVPVAVASSPDTDRIYLLEEGKSWQRVRGLAPADTKEEGGKTVSTWQTFFERNIGPADPALGRTDEPAAKAASALVDVTLEENPLSPGKHPHAKFTATTDEKGSYLATADGLRLRQVSTREHLRIAKLTKDKDGGGLSLFQTDGAAWDQFAIHGVRKVIEFDAGEFEIDAAGEKPVAEKAPDPEG